MHHEPPRPELHIGPATNMRFDMGCRRTCASRATIPALRRLRRRSIDVLPEPAGTRRTQHLDPDQANCPQAQDHSEVELRGSKYWNQAMDSRAPSRHSREACPRPRSGSGNPSRSTNPEARSLKPSSRLLKSPALRPEKGFEWGVHDVPEVWRVRRPVALAGMMRSPRGKRVCDPTRTQPPAQAADARASSPASRTRASTQLAKRCTTASVCE